MDEASSYHLPEVVNKFEQERGHEPSSEMNMEEK
jgi:hypothetical protein